MLNIEDNGCETVCVGVFNFVNEGEFLELTGEFVFHPAYGMQFKVQHSQVSIPQTAVSIEKYLASGAIKGIGKVTAGRIVRIFGEDTLRIIDEEPERLAQVKGISMKKAQEIAAAQEEKKDLRKAMIFLGNLGISNTLAVKIYKQYENDVYDILRENPYRLADDITGIGFRKADEIAGAAGSAGNSWFRIQSCILHVLVNAAGEGNVYLPLENLKKEVKGLLNTPDTVPEDEVKEEDIDHCITELAADNRVIVKDLPEGRQVYYTSYYYTELNIAGMLHNLNINMKIPEDEFRDRIAGVEESSDIILDEMQRKAVEMAAGSGVLVITGGPGTGKTTTINAIIKYFEQDGMEIFLAAPTGRAAKRMTEACGIEARTIHRMLELSGEIEDTSAGARFERNEDYPLEADVVIIDEMSMVDIFLMNALLKAVQAGTRLILSGDVDQLPSVGPGNVLRDIIDSENFPTVRLTKIFRQAQESEIITNAHRINQGEQINLRPDSKDFIFIRRDDPAVILGSILTLVWDKLPGYVHADMLDIQVLTPAKKGSLGVMQINRFLQANINPPSEEKNEIEYHDMTFREGDKVMHIKNNYSMVWEMKTKSGFTYDSGTGIFNGDIGIIKRINADTQLFEVLFDDGKNVIYTFEQLEELTLAYATTIHKAQGSEYPAVILPILSGPKVLMNRNILYTAVTRARKCVCIVGREEAVRSMIDNVREAQRYSGLKDRIEETRGHVL